MIPSGGGALSPPESYPGPRQVALTQAASRGPFSLARNGFAGPMVCDSENENDPETDPENENEYRERDRPRLSWRQGWRWITVVHQ